MSSIQFAYFLAGLIEGDGYFYTPAHLRTEKGQLLYPSVQIIFSSKDLPLALLILVRLGHGSLCRIPKKKVYVLTVTDRQGCIALAEMLNGKLRTSKITQFSHFLACLNTRYSTSFILAPKDRSPLFSNAWLVGFMEADGSFSLRCTLTGPQRRIEPAFMLEQAYSSEEDRRVFTEISHALLAPDPRVVNRKGKGKFWRMRTTSIAGNIRLMEYVLKHPLFGVKYLDFREWCKVVIMVRDKKHLLDESFSKVLAIKQDFNDARTTFDWTHVKKFFPVSFWSSDSKTETETKT